jgi:hypothetical protein
MEKLILIQAELKVPKANTNTFGKYKYRSAEDILEAVKPLLAKHKCTLVLTDEVVFVGNKLFLQASAKFSYLETTEIVKGFAEISEHKGMSAEQCTGTASSYARKYALNGLFLIDETENDIDSKDNTQPIAPAKETITAERFLAMLEKISTGEVLFDNVKNRFAFNDTQIAKLKELKYVS